ncbi:MAG TPA: PCRF domain-containing protein, partial [Kofleriaceae bacterium]|nr:PCRF domain-containing protein [Kofleriaceae bacterium]
GQKLGRTELAARIDGVAAAVETLAGAVGEAGLRAERERLDGLRQAPAFWRDTAAGAAVVDELDRVAGTLERVASLRARAEALAEVAPKAQLRREVQDAAHRVVQLEDALEVARRELCTMPPAGREDALVEVRPLGAAGRAARDLLVETYLAWAKEGRRARVEWLREPLEDDEPAMFAVQGRFASGYLAGESGLHRVRRGEAHSTAEVRVAPWSERAAQVAFGPHRALKSAGQYGGKIRSRVELTDGLVLQNARTLAENRELAAEIAGSWRVAAPAPDDITRRYDFDPFLLRDALTDTSTGRPDALSPARFHDLLCRRVDVRGQS